MNNVFQYSTLWIILGALSVAFAMCVVFFIADATSEAINKGRHIEFISDKRQILVLRAIMIVGCIPYVNLTLLLFWMFQWATYLAYYVVKNVAEMTTGACLKVTWAIKILFANHETPKPPTQTGFSTHGGDEEDRSANAKVLPAKCSYCGLTDSTWGRSDLENGWRFTGNGKHYHCEIGRVMD